MTLHVGETLTVVVEATDSLTEETVSGGTMSIDLFKPGKYPEDNPADRTVDVGPVSLEWNALAINRAGKKGAWTGYVPTTDWEPGRWTGRITLSNVYTVIAYVAIEVAA